MERLAFKGGGAIYLGRVRLSRQPRELSSFFLHERAGQA